MHKELKSGQDKMKKIKIFTLVEGKIIDELSDRVSGTFIRIHYILKYLKQHKDIKLIYIPFQYKQKYSQTYSRIKWSIDTFYHFAIPFLSLLIIIFRRPHFIYFSYPNVIYNDKFNIYLLRFAKRIGIKLLMYAHDWIEVTEVVGFGENPFISAELEEELVKNSDIVVAVSSKYPMYETIVLPGGLEPSEFKNMKYEIHENRFNIGFVGALYTARGINVLVDAAIELQKKYPHINLYLWGPIESLDGETIKKIKEVEFIIQEVIPRTQFINNFHKIDVFVYPADPNVPYMNAAYPTKLFEYIGSEIPFVATKCEGVKKISKGKGLLFADFSANNFCGKLVYLLKNPSERMRLSKELHELKKDNTWEKRADTLHGIIVNYLSKEKVNSE